MGLDMYMERYPRYKGFGPKQFNMVSAYFEWRDNPKAQEHTLEAWSGYKESELPCKEVLDELEKFYGERFYAWDDEHKYPTMGIAEHVGYWRKANAIHAWFVKHIQGGVDDCEYHREVTKDDLIALKSACEKVLNEAVLVDGIVKNGYRWKNGAEEPIYQDGKVVLNPAICREVLPSKEGFFFGSTGYDEWYIHDVQVTYELCKKLLEETDFETQQLYYCSSW